jgi:hypothetical protein
LRTTLNLNGYPNLPAWLSRFQIYGVRCINGRRARRLGRTEAAARSLACGWFFIPLDSTVCFTISARHLPRTIAMNLTIWSERRAALALMAVVAVMVRVQTQPG